MNTAKIYLKKISNCHFIHLNCPNADYYRKAVIVILLLKKCAVIFTKIKRFYFSVIFTVAQGHLCRLNDVNLDVEALIEFYKAITNSALTGSFSIYALKSKE